MICTNSFERAVVPTTPAGSNQELQFNNNGVFGPTTGLEWEASDSYRSGVLDFDDDYAVGFGAGGLTGNLGSDGRVYSTGAEMVVQVESPTNVLVPTNPVAKLVATNVLGGLVFCPSIDTLGVGAFFLQKPGLYLQGNGSTMFPQLLFQPTPGDVTNAALIQVHPEPYLQYSSPVSWPHSFQGGQVAINHASPSFQLDINGATRVQSVNYLNFGGTGAADNRVGLRWDTAGLGISGLNGTNNEAFRIDLESVANEIDFISLSSAIFTFGSNVRLDAQVGFNGNTPVGKSSAYTVTNRVIDRSYNCNATTVAELADVLGTLILDLQTVGLLG